MDKWQYFVSTFLVISIQTIRVGAYPGDPFAIHYTGIPEGFDDVFNNRNSFRGASTTSSFNPQSVFDTDPFFQQHRNFHPSAGSDAFSKVQAMLNSNSGFPPDSRSDFPANHFPSNPLFKQPSGTSSNKSFKVTQVTISGPHGTTSYLDHSNASPNLPDIFNGQDSPSDCDCDDSRSDDSSVHIPVASPANHQNINTESNDESSSSHRKIVHHATSHPVSSQYKPNKPVTTLPANPTKPVTVLPAVSNSYSGNVGSQGSSNLQNTAVLATAAAAGAMASSALYKNPAKPESQQIAAANTVPVQLPEKEKDCNWCMRSTCNPGGCRASPNFDPNKDAEVLRSAMKGIGTTESVLIEILTHRSEEQLEEIRQAYQGLGRHLDKDVAGETSSRIKDLFKALLQRRDEFYAEKLHDAFHSRNYNALVMILTSLSPCAVRQIGSAYYRKYEQSIVDDAKSHTNLKFENFIVELIKGNRDKDGTVDVEKARQDAEDLKKAGPDAWFKKKTVFIDIFTKRSYSHIRKVKELYDQLRSGSNLEKDVLEHSGGKELTKGLSVMLKNINNQPEYFAEEIEGAAVDLVGTGVRDHDTLIRILRGRCGIDLGDIREAYPKTHTNKPLEQLIRERTSGGYRKALLQLVSERSEQNVSPPSAAAQNQLPKLSYSPSTREPSTSET